MELLKQRILNEGRVINDNILKVDSFLNHQMDINFFNKIGREFKNIFKDDRIDKILTIESSGIGIACITAQYFNVPVVFAKKSLSSNLGSEVYQSHVFSFTKNMTYKILVSKSYIHPGENILIIDDFLANGQAVLGLSDVIKQAKANIVGAGIVIEKGFQDGRRILTQKGIRVESLAIIESMKGGKVVFK